MALLETELVEAIQASHDALEKLEAAKKCLQSASGWGVFDILGGGTISSAIKHARIKEAKEKFSAARESVAVFAEELDDIDEFVNVTFDTGGVLWAVDIFLDNVVADAIMQSRIREALEQIDGCIRQIRNVQADLSSRYHSLY